MRTQIYTFQTLPAERTQLIYTAEDWTKIRIQMETAGVVAFGVDQNLAPTVSGKGVLLVQDVPREMNLAPGDRLYIVSTGPNNRVNLIIEPIPWLGQILKAIEGVAKAIERLRP